MIIRTQHVYCTKGHMTLYNLDKIANIQCTSYNVKHAHYFQGVWHKGLREVRGRIVNQRAKINPNQ